MRVIRIFVSSPRDVGSERALASAVVERLRFEFRGIVDLQPVFWEQLPMLATDTFQSQIPSSSDAEVCIFILWSWFGTPLPDHFRKPDGSPYRSGTEYEFESAVAVHKVRGTPDILVYRKTAEPRASIRHREQVLEHLAQREAVQGFIDQYFHGEGGTFRAAFRQFETSAEFEEMLETHLRELVREKLRDLEGVAEVRWTTSPFRGLAAFDVDDAVIFCGRTQAVTEVIDALARQDAAGHPVVVVVGASGAGKSSLARAGVLPMVVQPRVVEGVGVWRRAVLRPSEGATPLDALAAALLRDGALPELAAALDAPRLAALLFDTPVAVTPLLGLSLGRVAEAGEGATHPGGLRAALLVLVDQMEELFAPTVAQPQRDAFALALATIAGHGVWVLGTLRADFQPRLAELPDAFAALLQGDGTYVLRPPRAVEVAQMIRRPAQMAGLLYERRPESEEGLDDVLRDAAIADPAALPLLQFALEQLWQRRDNRTLRFADYEAIGGLAGAVSSRAEATFAALPHAAQAALPRVLSALVRLDLAEDGGRVTQRRAERAALDQAPGAATLVDAFIEARLFVVDRIATGTPTVGVVHEALLRVWPRAQDWIAANERALQARTRVGTAEALWRHSGEQADHLLTGASLAEATALLAGDTLAIQDGTTQFINASARAARAHRRHVRMRFAVAAVILLAAAGAGYGYWDATIAPHTELYPLAFERRNGLVEPTRPPITAEEASHRHEYLRMTRRGRRGPIVSYVVLNGSGACPQDHDIGTIFFVPEPRNMHLCRFEFTVVDGVIQQEAGFNMQGYRAWTLVYSDTEHVAAGVFAPDGRAVALAGNGVSRVRFEHGEDGLDRQLRYFDAYGHPKLVPKGFYGTAFSYQGGALLSDVGFLGSDGEKIELSGHVAGWHLEYDAAGRLVKRVVHGPNGEAVAEAPSAVAITRTSYDEHDNIVQVAFFDASDHPIRGPGGYAGFRNRYDRRGNRVETTWFNESGNVAAPPNGWAMVKREFDAEGRQVREIHLDANGTPIVIKGSAGLAVTYDPTGRLLRQTNLDAAGRPARDASGVVTREQFYDAAGRFAGQRFLDDFEQPMLAANGTAGFRVRLDEFDNQVVLVNLGLDGKPVRFEGTRGAEIRRTFNERGQPITTSSYDVDGSPMRIGGVFRHTVAYDDAGNMIREALEDLDGRPAVNSDGVHENVFIRDLNGDVIERRQFGIDGKPPDTPGMCARIVSTFDDARAETSNTCLDRDGLPMLRKEGYATFRVTRDAAGRETERIWLDANGKAVSLNGGCGHEVNTYENDRKKSRCVQ